MEEEKAVKFLTKKLVEHYGRTILFNTLHQDRIIRNAKYVYTVGDLKIIGYSIAYKRDLSKGIFEIGYNTEKKQPGGKSIGDILQEGCSDETNYLFASHPLGLDNVHVYINVVPYAIIGDKEHIAIKEKFYNSSDLAVREAIGSLEIENFSRLHEKIDCPRQFLAFYRFIADLFQNPKVTKYFNKDGHYHLAKFPKLLKKDHDLNLIDKLVSRLNVRCGYINSRTELCTEDFGKLMRHLSQYPDFFRFAFDQPSDEQTIELNKFLLKNHPSFFNINTILIKEYSQGQSFKEHFEILSKYQKEDVTHLLKDCQPKDPEYKSFLLGLDFKQVINLSDYRLWYENDSQKFIEYFQEESKEKKIVILRDIFELDVTNQKVTEWLDKNESEAVREVGVF
ncbi:MAG: hypothetical protein ISS23_02830 [Nanoarchaeota archaeon]|nr:hypothetical protein [Nanoarchaeota archaeon]